MPDHRDPAAQDPSRGPTAELLRQLITSGQPIVLTINHGVEFSVQDSQSLQMLLELVDRLEARRL